MDRREFIGSAARAAAGIAAAAVAAPSIASGREQNDRIRIAVMGIRGRGRSHIDGFASMKDVIVAAVCDPDSRLLAGAAEAAEKKQGAAPEKIADVRRIIEDRSLDALAIAAPDHWHAPAAIWACQAGKDVYVEKPCAHNFREAQLLVAAARKHGRVVQHGTQSRSAEHIQKAIEFLRSGKLGRILQAKALNCQKRDNIGHKGDEAVPEGVDYDLWLGPAPKRPFNPNRFHYNWHWFWDYGTGDLGNDGVHQMDIARWGLGVELPQAVSCGGGKYYFDDDQETPDTQVVVFEYPHSTLIYEMRLWTPYREHGIENGNIFYGEDGYLELDSRGWRVFFKNGEKGPGGPFTSERGADHMRNFIDCMRSRGRPAADIEEGFNSSALCHLGNIAYRTGRRLRIDPRAQAIIGDPEASALLRREHRPPFTIADAI